MHCPCNSNLAYADCCQPFHENRDENLPFPDTAEQLMRSRYSAFVLQKTDYIVATTLPAQQPFLDKQAISDWAKDTDWAGLEVINHMPKLSKHHASVAFNAYFNVVENAETKRLFHHELSYFVKAGKDDVTKWYFLDPTLNMSISQKQPCICGSGEKFKRCCGKFLA